MPLMDQLLVPRFADAEAIHGADLHVGDHLRRRHHDGFDVLVGIDAAGGQPVADPEIMRAARESHRGLDRFARAFFFSSATFSGVAVDADLEVGIFLGDRDALALRLSRARMYIGVGTLFCVTLPADIRYGIGVRICAPSMPLPSEPSTRLSRVVPHDACFCDCRRRACRIWQTGPSPWRRTAASIRQRDEAELGAGHFRARSLRKRAGGEIQFGGGEQRGGSGGRLQDLTAAEAVAGGLVDRLRHGLLASFACMAVRPVSPRGSA